MYQTQFKMSWCAGQRSAFSLYSVIDLRSSSLLRPKNSTNESGFDVRKEKETRISSGRVSTITNAASTIAARLIAPALWQADAAQFLDCPGHKWRTVCSEGGGGVAYR